MLSVFFSLFILWNLFRGYKEGIVMSMSGDKTHTGLIEGIRGHKYFSVYHNISALGDFLLFFSGICFCYIELTIHNLLLILGFLFLGWSTFEIGYSFARYESVIPPTENILGSGIYANGNKVMLLFIGRIIMALLLIWLSFSL